MASAELLIGLLGCVALLTGAARWLGLPAPIPLTAGGVLIGLVPGLPSPQLDPDVVFFVFLPPLVYIAGFRSSPRDLRAQARRIAILAVGLVVATTAAVALAVHAIVPGFGWPEAFVLGAVLAPTDPVAAVSIMQRLHVPPQLTALVEGESLVNDGVGLVLYRLAVGATVSGTFSLAGGVLGFVAVAAGGIAAGLAVGWLIAHVRGRIEDPSLQIATSLFTPYAAYIAAEAVGVSGVLAAVFVGLYLGSRHTGLFPPAVRVEAVGFWNAVSYLLESALFLLMGLQFADVAGRIAGRDAATVAAAVLVTTLVVIGLRLAWMFTMSPLLRALLPGQPREEPPPLGAGARLVAGWAGMRGAVSLAAALAIPGHVGGGAPFPERDLIVFVVFCVILVGLLVQGTTLPWLVRATGVGGSAEDRDAAEARGRAAAAEAALGRLERCPPDDEEAARELRRLYEARLEHSRAPAHAGGDEQRRHVEAVQRLREDLLRAEREAIQDLHDRGELSEDALRTIERDLDLQEARLP